MFFVTLIFSINKLQLVQNKGSNNTVSFSRYNNYFLRIFHDSNKKLSLENKVFVIKKIKVKQFLDETILCCLKLCLKVNL